MKEVMVTSQDRWIARVLPWRGLSLFLLACMATGCEQKLKPRAQADFLDAKPSTEEGQSSGQTAAPAGQTSALTTTAETILKEIVTKEVSGDTAMALRSNKPVEPPGQEKDKEKDKEVATSVESVALPAGESVAVQSSVLQGLPDVTDLAQTITADIGPLVAAAPGPDAVTPVALEDNGLPSLPITDEVVALPADTSPVVEPVQEPPAVLQAVANQKMLPASEAPVIAKTSMDGEPSSTQDAPPAAGPSPGEQSVAQLPDGPAVEDIVAEAPQQPAGEAIPVYPDPIPAAEEVVATPAPAVETPSALAISSEEILVNVDTTPEEASAIAQTLNEELAKVDKQLDKKDVSHRCSKYMTELSPLSAKKVSHDKTCSLLKHLQTSKGKEKLANCVDAVYVTFRLRWASGDLSATKEELDGQKNKDEAKEAKKSVADDKDTKKDKDEVKESKKSIDENKGALLVQKLSQDKLEKLAKKDKRATRALGKVEKLALKKQCQ